MVGSKGLVAARVVAVIAIPDIVIAMTDITADLSDAMMNRHFRTPA